MGYDILSRVIEFTDSEEPLEKRLEDVADLLVKFFGFDQCAVYLLDQEKHILRLAVVSGDKTEFKKEYRDDEGLPAVAIKGGKPVFITQFKRIKDMWQDVADTNIRGFRTIVCHPIKDDLLYGMLYLRSRDKKIISPKKKRLLAVISLQLSAAIKNYKCIINLTEVNTKIKEMQARLIHAEKLLALGEMAATLAHEIRNPLVSIGGFAKRLRQQFTPDSHEMTYVDRIVKEVERLEKLMGGIVNFSMKEGYEFYLEDINSVVEEALQFFEDDIERRGIKLVKELSLNIPKIAADRQQMKLVFNNLLANAIQAMQNGGMLTIQTRREGNWITAEVNDTGGGIDPKIMGNIFNPFYTTKETGTGLGLSITHSIVTNHKGMIEVNNNVGVGATFIIKLPVANEKKYQVGSKQ